MYSLGSTGIEIHKLLQCSQGWQAICMVHQTTGKASCLCTKHVYIYIYIYIYIYRGLQQLNDALLTSFLLPVSGDIIRSLIL